MKKILIFIIFLILTLFGIIIDYDPNNNKEQIELNEKQEKYTVKRVIDGDTFVLNNKQKVRLLGIDTPEKGEFYYKEATERLKDLVEGKKVLLKKDVSDKDRYGRLLRHVYLDDLWINAIMIKEGYARFVIYRPDISHVDKFKKLERDAKKNKLGIWSKKD